MSVVVDENAACGGWVATVTSWRHRVRAVAVVGDGQRTWNVPELVYVCDGLAAELVAPSPKSHAYDSIVPSGSFEPELSNDTFAPVTVDVNAAVGSWFGAWTVTSCETVPVPPLLSVTVSVTVYVPAAR